MEPKKATKFHPELIELYNLYIHGEISRRQFMDSAKRFAVGGVTVAALWDALKGIPGAKQRPDGHAGRSITLRGEAGDITINPDAVGSSNAVRYSTWGVVSDHNADAVERDLQKRRALAAYAAQPGWGGGDG